MEKVHRILTLLLVRGSLAQAVRGSANARLLPEWSLCANGADARVRRAAAVAAAVEVRLLTRRRGRRAAGLGVPHLMGWLVEARCARRQGPGGGLRPLVRRIVRRRGR